MALKVVSMNELKLQVLLEPERTGESVAEVCLRRGSSRASFYRYRRRLLQEGPEGLEPHSRRPRVSPARIEAALEAGIRADLETATNGSDAPETPTEPRGVSLRSPVTRVVEPAPAALVPAAGDRST